MQENHDSSVMNKYDYTEKKAKKIHQKSNNYYLKNDGKAKSLIIYKDFDTNLQTVQVTKAWKQFQHIIYMYPSKKKLHQQRKCP